MKRAMSPAQGPDKGVEALSLMLKGETEAGLALYRRRLRGNAQLDPPIALHPLFLRQAHREESASRLTELALEFGANVAVKASGLGAEPSEAATEYETLFAEGTANSKMIGHYLRVLADLGRFEDIAAILDSERLLKISRLDRGLAASVEGLLLELEPAAEEQEAVQSVRRMRMVNRFSELEHPAAIALTAALSREVADYMDSWRTSDHPFASHLPSRYTVEAWGLISRGEGYNTRHIHHRGWATGVYYPTTVDSGLGGELVIGRPDDAKGSEGAWGTRHVRPEAGLLVLMPSYYTHWTVPLERPSVRTSVAFDVIAQGQS